MVIKFKRSGGVLFFLFCIFHHANAWFMEELTSPFTTDATYVFYPGIITTLFIAGYEHQKLSDEAKSGSQRPMSANSKKFIHYGDTLGMGILNGGYVIGQLIAGNNLDAKVMLKVSLYSTLSTWVLKPVVRERRPNGSDHNSFPSGHTSLAFSFGTTLLLRHPWYVGTIGMMVATFIGVSRIYDNAHWLHDVVGGAVIGASYAIGVNQLNQENSDKSAYMILPTSSSPGIQFAYIRQF